MKEIEETHVTLKESEKSPWKWEKNTRWSNKKIMNQPSLTLITYNPRYEIGITS